MRVASTDYFRAMEIPLRKGRFFSEHDTADMPQVAIIDEKFAQRFWPHDDAIGKHVWFDPKKPITIVGVVGAVKQYGLETDGKIATYFPAQQDADRGMFLVARTSSDPAGLSAAVVSEIHAVDPDVVGLRHSHHAGPSVRFAGAPALLPARCWVHLRFRPVAGGRGTLRRDVVPGDAEHSRYRRARGIGRTAREYHHGPTTPASPEGETGLGCCDFARHYYRNRGFFLFLQVLRWFTSLGSLAPDYGFIGPYGGFTPVGFPIRKSPDQSLLAAPRGLSQLATSFIAVFCQGIHHAPLVA